MIEIERKFLVKSTDFKKKPIQIINIKQAYFNDDVKKSVRVRICDKEAFITIKGPSLQNGISRYEWEKKINLNEGIKLLKLCNTNLVEKRRYIINYKNSVFEVDEFLGKNLGLVTAEIELDKTDQKFERPNWIGKEVTGIEKYYNLSLVSYPFSKWK